MLTRPADHGDITQIAELWNAMIRDTTATFTTQQKTAADIEAMLEARRDAFLVAGAQGNCAGFITWGHSAQGRDISTPPSIASSRRPKAKVQAAL